MLTVATCRAIESQPSPHLLNGSYLGDEGTMKLCDSLIIHCSVLKIELKGCEIHKYSSKGLKSIASILNKSRNVLHIRRLNCCFARRHFGILYTVS